MAEQQESPNMNQLEFIYNQIKSLGIAEFSQQFNSDSKKLEKVLFDASGLSREEIVEYIANYAFFTGVLRNPEQLHDGYTSTQQDSLIAAAFTVGLCLGLGDEVAPSIPLYAFCDANFKLGNAVSNKYQKLLKANPHDEFVNTKTDKKD